MTEQEIIQLFYKKGQAPFLDDCAFLEGRKEGLLHTTDALVEGTHFRLSWSEPEHLARKLLHVNLSDILSSGGTPLHAFLTLGIPKELPDAFLVRFAETFCKELAIFEIELLGGDSFRAPALFLGLHLVGNVFPFSGGKPVERSGGNPGECLYLTGELGRSLLGYRLLSDLENSLGEHAKTPNSLKARSEKQGLEAPLWKQKKNSFSHFELQAIERHLAPQSRSDIAEEILKNYNPSAMIDISDGLVSDAMRLATASGLCLELDITSLPVDAKLSPEDALVSGEELELLFLSAVPPDEFLSSQIHCIGRAVEIREGGQALRLIEKEREIPLPQGFRHW